MCPLLAVETLLIAMRLYSLHPIPNEALKRITRKSKQYAIHQNGAATLAQKTTF